MEDQDKNQIRDLDDRKYDTPIEAYADLRGRDLSKEDLSKIPTETLLKCNFDDETKWPEVAKLPEGFNPAEVLKSCQNPGLGIRQIHEEGINGRGVVVAIIDQSLSNKRGEFIPHSEYADRIVGYKEFGVSEDEGISMHGPAVTSLLVGKNCGIAPKAEVVYRAVKSGDRDFNHSADALLDLVKFNRDAPPNRKIRIVSCSIGYQEQKLEPGLDRWIAAIKLAEDEGIVVSDVGERTGVDYIGGGAPADKENPDSYNLALFLKERDEKIFTDPEMIKLIRNKDVEGIIKRLRALQPKETSDISDEELRPKVEKFLNSPDSNFGMIIPSDYRTMASYNGVDQYAYNGKGGMSWAVPYLTGIFALVWQLRPNLSKNEIADIINRTATVNSSGLSVINPAEIIEEVRSI